MPSFEENHAAIPSSLGRLVANLLSLELAIRLFLTKANGDDFVDKNPHAAREGEWVNLTALTDFSPLSDLLKRYNRFATEDGIEPISKEIVGIRDAIAHGRLATIGDGDRFHLIKYSKPNNGRVKVEFNQQCSAEWFAQTNQQLRDAIRRVLDHINSRFPGAMVAE